MSDILLETKGLKVSFRSDFGVSRAVDGVDFQVEKGKVLGIVGESGSGKSVTSLAVMGLVPRPNGYVEDGQILFHGQDLLRMSGKEMRRIRGNRIAMIFQEPMSSLNPVFKIGDQLGEALKLHQGVKGKENWEKCVEMLELVRVADPRKLMNRYPHELSGGMRQRVMIAMAVLCSPELMIADEPTTALDVTIQAQILALLRELQQQRRMSIMFITHDLGVISEIADRVIVMYAGRVVEEADVRTLLDEPLHPSTRGLLAAIPENYLPERGFYAIPGVGGDPRKGTGCRFAPRCGQACQRCREQAPRLAEAAPGHRVSCFLYGKDGESDG